MTSLPGAILATGTLVNQSQPFRSLGLAVMLFVASVTIAGCGSGGASGPAATLVINGPITGLEGSGLVLQNNGGGDLVIRPAQPEFVFTGISEGSAYNVTVKTQPTVPSQTCTVSNGAGVARDAVRTVSVSCTTKSFAVRGFLTDVTTAGLTLALNGGGPLSISVGATTFAFPPILSGTHYTVTIIAQPSGRTCSINGGAGVVGAADVINVAVTCGAPGSTIGGTISGLGSSGLTLRLNGGTPLPIAAVGGVGSFAFPNVLQPGDNYSITVVDQPLGPRQTCVLNRAKGRVAGGSITDVFVRCFPNGSLDSYAGTYAVLLNGRRSYFTLWLDGTFSLATRIDDGSCANNGNGIEYGTYRRATGGAFSIWIAVVDGNGTCGFWGEQPNPTPGAGYEGTMVRNGNQLTLTSVSQGSFVLDAVESMPASLVGAFTRDDGVDGSFIVFESDGTYLYQEAQRGSGSISTPPGYERGCYLVSGSNLTTSLAAACLPNGFPSLDLNGAAGFSAGNGAPIPFTITSPTTIIVGGVQYNRILPAG